MKTDTLSKLRDYVDTFETMYGDLRKIENVVKNKHKVVVRPKWVEHNGWPPGKWGEFIAGSFEKYLSDTFGQIDKFEVYEDVDGMIVYVLTFQEVDEATDLINTESLYLKFMSFDVTVDLEPFKSTFCKKINFI
jgi:hypothetical protein